MKRHTILAVALGLAALLLAGFFLAFVYTWSQREKTALVATMLWCSQLRFGEDIHRCSEAWAQQAITDNPDLFDRCVRESGIGAPYPDLDEFNTCLTINGGMDFLP